MRLLVIQKRNYKEADLDQANVEGENSDERIIRQTGEREGRSPIRTLCDLGSTGSDNRQKCARLEPKFQRSML